MESERKNLLDKKGRILESISSAELMIDTLTAELTEGKTRAERRKIGEDVEKYREYIESMKSELQEVEKKLDSLKRFKRKRCLENIDYLLAKNDIKLGSLETESGNNPGYLSRMKSGKTNSDPTIEFLMTASEMFEIPLEMLVASSVSEMTGTEEFINDFLKKVYNETSADKILWTKETDTDLKNLAVNVDDDGDAWVDHPLYTCKNQEQDGITLYEPRYRSLFFEKCDVRPYGNCYHAMLAPTDTEVYIVDCEKVDKKSSSKGERFYELYLITSEGFGREVSKLCNTLEASSPIVATINSLVKAIILSMAHVHIDAGVRSAIEEYMKCSSSETEDSDLPFGG